MNMLQTGDIIRKLRMQNKYTQSELATMLGLNLSTLQKYESGAIQNLKLETLRELCHIFEVPPIAFVFPDLDEKLKPQLMEWAFANIVGLNSAGMSKVFTYIDDLMKINEYTKK